MAALDLLEFGAHSCLICLRAQVLESLGGFVVAVAGHEFSFQALVLIGTSCFDQEVLGVNLVEGILASAEDFLHRVLVGVQRRMCLAKKVEERTIGIWCIGNHLQ